MIYRLGKMENSRKLHMTGWNLGRTSYGMLVARYLWKLKSENRKRKRKKKNRSKWKAKEVLRGGGGSLNFEKDSRWNKDQLEESWKFENNDKWHKSPKW